MKIKCYPDNPYYQLLICLIIRFQITNIDANGSSLFSEDAKTEINEIVFAIGCILNNQNSKKYEYLLHEILDFDFFSLKNLSAHAVRKLTYFNTIDIPECVLELVYEYEELFIDAPLKAFVKENSIYNMLKDTMPRYLQMLAESIAKDKAAINDLWKNQSLKPIHLAVISGKKNILEAIIEDGNSDQTNAHGDTLLHYSCYWNHPKITAYLLAANADAFLKNAEGELPIHYACLTGNIGSLKILLKKNNQLKNHRTNNGWFPLFYSLIYTNDKKQYINLMELLRPFHTRESKFEHIELFLYFLKELKTEIENSSIFGKNTICSYLEKYLTALISIENFPNNLLRNIKLSTGIHIALLAVFSMIFFTTNTNTVTANQYWVYFSIPVSTILISLILSIVYFLYKHEQNQKIVISDALRKMEQIKLTENNLFFSKSNQTNEQVTLEKYNQDSFSEIIEIKDESTHALPSRHLR